MILVDTAVWIAHVCQPIADLADMLDQGQIGVHPFVIGELSLGNLRPGFLDELRRLPHTISASHREVMILIGREALAGTGIGYIDAHLLASALLTPRVLIWTRDRRLRVVAERMGVAADLV